LRIWDSAGIPVILVERSFIKCHKFNYYPQYSLVQKVDNQYVYTEIAPYPQVKLDSLVLGGVWHNKLAILMGWGAFNGKTSSQ
jgi:hypothetical protein